MGLAGHNGYSTPRSSPRQQRRPSFSSSSPRSPLQSPLQQHHNTSSARCLSYSAWLSHPRRLVRILLLPLLMVTQLVLHQQRGSGHGGTRALPHRSSTGDAVAVSVAPEDLLQLAVLPVDSSQQQQQQQQQYTSWPLSLQLPTTVAGGPLPVAWIAARRGDSDANDSFATTFLDDALMRSQHVRLMQRIEYDASTRSTHVYSHNTHPLQQPNTVLSLYCLIDWASLDRDCHVLERILTQMTTMQQAQPQPQQKHMIFYDTTSSLRIQQCPHLDARFGTLSYPYVKQSITQGRFWNQQKLRVEPGSILQPPPTTTSRQFLQTTPGLEQHFVHRLNNILLAEKQYSNILQTLFQRKTHVALWARNVTSHAGYTFYRSHLARQVHKRAHAKAWSVKALGEPTIVLSNHHHNNNNNHNNNTDHHHHHHHHHARLDDTIRNLMDAKIVVFTHPDEWQDTTGILEAMACGALVLCESMILPPPGWVNKTNILFYNDKNTLLSLIEYYLKHDNERLQIAKKGWEYTMGWQRSWHSVETLLFGVAGRTRPLSHSQEDDKGDEDE